MAFRSLAPALLLAAPRLRDPNFERSVVLLGRHEEEGALGWVLNGADLHPVGDLLRAARLIPPSGQYPDTTAFRRYARVGGPVRPESGWLLYRSGVASFPGELEVGRLRICNRPEALHAVIRGEPPHDFHLLLGYAGWGPGQLESEIQANGWLHCPADPELIFNVPLEAKYDRALRRLGIDPGMLSGDAGHA